MSSNYAIIGTTDDYPVIVSRLARLAVSRREQHETANEDSEGRPPLETVGDYARARVYNDSVAREERVAADPRFTYSCGVLRGNMHMISKRARGLVSAVSVGSFGRDNSRGDLALKQSPRLWFERNIGMSVLPAR